MPINNCFFECIYLSSQVFWKFDRLSRECVDHCYNVYLLWVVNTSKCLCNYPTSNIIAFLVVTT